MRKQKQYPVIYQFTEKHGDRFCQCNSKEGEDKMFFEILKERFELGYYSWMKDYSPYGKVKPDFTQEDIDKLPDSMNETKLQMSKKLKDYIWSEKSAEKIKNKYKSIAEGIKSKDMTKATDLMNSMTEGEYERFETIQFETYD